MVLVLFLVMVLVVLVNGRGHVFGVPCHIAIANHRMGTLHSQCHTLYFGTLPFLGCLCLGPKLYPLTPELVDEINPKSEKNSSIRESKQTPPAVESVFDDIHTLINIEPLETRY